MNVVLKYIFQIESKLLTTFFCSITVHQVQLNHTSKQLHPNSNFSPIIRITPRPSYAVYDLGEAQSIAMINLGNGYSMLIDGIVGVEGENSQSTTRNDIEFTVIKSDEKLISDYLKLRYALQPNAPIQKFDGKEWKGFGSLSTRNSPGASPSPIASEYLQPVYKSR